jgi:hypothetical protein
VFVLNNERRIIKAHLRKGNRYTVMEEHLWLLLIKEPEKSIPEITKI